MIAITFRFKVSLLMRRQLTDRARDFDIILDDVSIVSSFNVLAKHFEFSHLILLHRSPNFLRYIEEELLCSLRFVTFNF